MSPRELEFNFQIVDFHDLIVAVYDIGPVFQHGKTTTGCASELPSVLEIFKNDKK